jgi:hypothetical protein
MNNLRTETMDKTLRAVTPGSRPFSTVIGPSSQCGEYHEILRHVPKRLPSIALPPNGHFSLSFPNIPPEIAAIEFNHAGGIVSLSACAENGIAYSGNP